MKHDIINTERVKEPNPEVTSVRSDLQTSVTGTKQLLSTEFGTIRSGIEEARSTMALRQGGLQTELRIGNDKLR